MIDHAMGRILDVVQRYRVPDDRLRERLTLTVSDLLAVVLAGGASDLTKKKVPKRVEEGAYVWARGIRTELGAAIQYNSLCGHLLDFDDMTEILFGHYSVVTMPVLVGLWEKFGNRHSSFADAYFAGMAGIRELSRMLDINKHYSLGFHSTVTLGAFGAALAAGKFMGYDRQRLNTVANLTASTTLGLRKCFGTIVKPIQVSWAAENVFRAVSMVENGVLLDTDLLSGEFGVFHFWSPDEALAAGGIGSSRVDHLFEFKDEDLLPNVKLYPCCYGLAKILTAAKDIRLSLETLGDCELRHLEFSISKRTSLPLVMNWPRSSVQAQFSPRFVVSLMLRDGRLGLDSFSDRNLRDGQLIEMGERIRFDVRDGFMNDPDNVKAVLDLSLNSMTITKEFHVDVAVGYRGRGLDGGIGGKLDNCLAYSGLEGLGGNVIRAARGIVGGDFSPYFELMDRVYVGD